MALHIDDFGDDFGLVYDRVRIINNAKELLTSLGGYSIHFSVKSFPCSDVLDKVSDDVHGWDISSLLELRLIEKCLRPQHSISLMNFDTTGLTEVLELGHETYLTLDHTSDLQFHYPDRLKLGLRLDPHDLLGKGHSRYGFLLEEITSLPEDILSRIRYIHTHCPGMVGEIELQSLRAAIDRIVHHFTNLEFINLGGGLSRQNINVYESIAQQYPDLQLAVEPGRWFSDGAGMAYTKIEAMFHKNGDLYLVGKLSPEAHLKWSRDVSYSFLGAGVKKKQSFSRLIYSSKNALEGDQILLQDKPGELSVGIGDWLIFENISGYAVAWNHEFNGISRARVRFLD